MNEQTIRMLIKLVEESDIDTLEVRKWFRTIRITKTRAASNGHHPAGAHPATLVNIPVAAPPAPQPQTQSAPAAAAPSPAPAPSNLVEIKSPMVGTFYRAASPESPSFVEVGKIIKPGDVLCIIEAMKLMNDIEAEHSGRIVKILVENGQPVEFGQPLFQIDPTGA